MDHNPPYFYDKKWRAGKPWNVEVPERKLTTEMGTLEILTKKQKWEVLNFQCWWICSFPLITFNVKCELDGKLGDFLQQSTLPTGGLDLLLRALQPHKVPQMATKVALTSHSRLLRSHLWIIQNKYSLRALTHHVVPMLVSIYVSQAKGIFLMTCVSLQHLFQKEHQFITHYCHY